MDLQNAAVIVTGGASGLGEATARHFADKGAKVAIFDLNTERGQALASEIGGKFFAVDVTSDESVSEAVEAAQSAHGVARILVNCAGIAPPAKAVDREGQPVKLSKFSKVVEINLIGTFNTVSKFAAKLQAADADTEGARGVIINTASIAAYEGQIGQAAYAASKAGVIGMCLPLAREFARYGIRVVTIAPGVFWTPMMEGLPPEVQETLGKQVPFPSRLGRPEEFALLAQSIVDNPLLNGEVIRLDGALRMGA